MSMIKCSECSNLISDKASVCPNCGCPISFSQQTVKSSPILSNTATGNREQQSSLYPQIRAFADSVKTIYTLSVIGLVLCLGIGFIFALINIAKLKALVPVTEQITNPYELAEYQTAERKLKTARIFFSNNNMRCRGIVIRRYYSWRYRNTVLNKTSISVSSSIATKNVF